MIDFVCPHCRQHQEASQETTGELSACQGCGGVIQVPIILDEGERVLEPV